MNLAMRDNRNSTPLHWACFSNSEVALIYILGWVKEDRLGMQDVDGYTPLHLAVKAAEQLNSGRPIRALLVRGADRDIKDKIGRKPIDLVNEIKTTKLRRELN